MAPRNGSGMCGRYTYTKHERRLVRELRVPEQEELEFLEDFRRFNLAPTQQAPVVFEDDTGRHAALFKWGLIPFWAPDAKIGNQLINARADTVASKPSFRSSFKRKRCLVLADGFYEWQKLPSGGKQPVWIHLAGGEPFTFAGLWDAWQPDKAAEPVRSFTIITTDANELLAAVHNRMPVILPPESREQWLDAKASPDRLQELLRPFPSDRMAFHPVSTIVNSPRNESPECVKPIG